MSDKKVAIFPGSFDPITVGHEAIVRRGLVLFDEIIVAVGYNSNKSTYFSLSTRMAMIEKVFEDEPTITVRGYDGLTVEFAKDAGAQFILRGIRTSADFEYERAIAQVNKKMTGIESVFLLTTPEQTPVNSTIVRDILRHGGDASMFLPEKINIKDFI
ncbi:pantetheine-phosphate adenylyltransferase [Saccharicrinis sp. FJH62]|uniref:pantetheine-phosphate adenylyltransferase n=1 Tax=Saccharicrinis sp. FJH62 TaxID=3344657 RepID=UPI0035D3F0D7